MTLEEIENWSLKAEINSKALQAVLSTYFNLKNIGSINRNKDIRINFLHKTYQEFFLAEHLIESYLDGNLHYLNVGNPSEVTVNFLHGFLDLLSADKETVERYVMNSSNNDVNTRSLFYSVGFEDPSENNATNIHIPCEPNCQVQETQQSSQESQEPGNTHNVHDHYTG